MRVNPNPGPDILSALWQTQAQEQTALQELASGKRVNVPSDDPLAAALMVANQDQENQAAQYLQNIDTLTTQAQTADSALSSVVQSLNQAIGLGVQASDPALSASNQQQIAQNLQGIQAQLIQLANTSVAGNYLFGGTASTATPFTAAPANPSGVQYNGNGGTNTVAIGNASVVRVNVPGDRLFLNSSASVFGSVQQLITKAEENNLVGADLAQIATDLTRAQTAHEASLAAAAKILPTSL